MLILRIFKGLTKSDFVTQDINDFFYRDIVQPSNGKYRQSYREYKRYDRDSDK